MVNDMEGINSNYKTLFKYFNDCKLMNIYCGKECIGELMNAYLSINVEDIVNAILVRNIPILTVTDIPIFSSFNDCTEKLCFALKELNNCGCDYDELGHYLLGGKQNVTANYKYGENHSKAAALLGLTKIVRESKSKVYLTDLGYSYLYSDPTKREHLLTRSFLSTNIAQYYIQRAQFERFKVFEPLEFMSTSTIIRRISNIKTFFNILDTSDEFNFHDILQNIQFEYPKGEKHES